MSILNQLASAMNRRDEEPNEILAQRLSDESETGNVGESIQELVDNLHHKKKGIRSDCIKVLYEIGARKPQLIENYVDEFVAILSSKDNRLVWGGMTALGSIAARKPREIWTHHQAIIDTTKNGSVITQDWGIRVLAIVSAEDEKYAAKIFPFLLEFLADCRPKDVPRHAESIVMTVQTPSQRTAFIAILKAHIPQLKPSQLKRVQRVMQEINKANLG
jgi:hypothetical protein